MPAAEPHPQEVARQAALNRLDVLDTAPEQMFDGLVELASMFLGVPISVVSLIDNDRQWFKARFGIDATETARSQAFCAHAILDCSELLVVEDATLDPRFLDNPLVTGEVGIRFYAGATIKSPDDGLPLGTLCIIDQKPRQISERELGVLKKLAKQVEHLLALRAAIKENDDATLALCESEAKVRGIIDNGQTFVGLMTPDGTLIDANRSSLAAAGVAADVVLGKPFWETPWWSHSKELQERLQQAVRLVASGQTDRFEATHPTEDGEVIDVDFSLSPIAVAGEVAYLVPEGRDITLQKQRERENEQYCVELRETNSDLEQFAYVASHDLRSPLRGISSLATFIEDDEGDNLSESSKVHLEKLQSRILRMQQLLDDLLSYSRVGHSSEQAVEIGTSRLIAEILELLSIPEGFEVTVPADLPDLIGHVTPLRQVLLNLISNAVKHHDNNQGSISITVTEQSGLLEFRITDDGPGIDEQYHKQIFEMFKTLNPRDQVEGSGMGLAIIRKLVRRYGGNVAVESPTGRGTTFVFTWPKSPRSTTPLPS